MFSGVFEKELNIKVIWWFLSSEKGLKNQIVSLFLGHSILGGVMGGMFFVSEFSSFLITFWFWANEFLLVLFFSFSF